MNRLLFVNLAKTTFTGRYEIVTWQVYLSVHDTLEWMQTKRSTLTFDDYSAGREVERLSKKLNCEGKISFGSLPILSWDDLELRGQLTLRDANEQTKLR